MKRILVASHFRSTVARLKRYLADADVDIVARSKIETVLNELLHAQLPHLMIVDETVSETRGDVLVSFIRKIPSFANLPIILLASEAALKDLQRLDTCGATACMPTTFRSKQIAEVARPYLQRRTPLTRDAS